MDSDAAAVYERFVRIFSVGFHLAVVLSGLAAGVVLLARLALAGA